MTLLIPLDFSLLHSNKENEASSLNGTAPPTRHLRDTSKNPYSKNYCKPRSSSAGSQDILPSRTSIKAATTKHGSKVSSLSTIEEETSPTIRQILEATGCSSRQEFLAMKAAQANTNGSKPTNMNALKAAPNVPKVAPNGAKKGAKNGAKNGAKSSSKGSKSTNPKNKSKSKYFA